MWDNKLTIEAVNGLLPEASCNPTVNTFIFITLKFQKVLKQIQHLCHLSNFQLKKASVQKIQSGNNQRRNKNGAKPYSMNVMSGQYFEVESIIGTLKVNYNS